MYVLFTILIVILYVAFFLIGIIIPKSPVIINLLGFGIFFSQGVFNMVLIVMLNNTIEYDELLSGKRNEGIYMVFCTFIPKIVAIFAQSVPLTIMSLLGFKAPEEKNINEEQPIGVIRFIKIVSEKYLYMILGFL